MPLIQYLPEEKEVEVDPSETILAASLRCGIPHAHACGGNARCSTCRIIVLDHLDHCAPRNDLELQLAERLSFTPEIRLACQTTVRGDIQLRKLALDEEDIEIIERLSEGVAPSPVGEERVIAILFADIRGFTAIAESMPPYDVMYLLNRYFNQMDAVIRRNGGYIDNLIGDGIMALFGTEDEAETGRAALDAVRAGLEMLQTVERLKPYLEAAYDRTLRIGVGVHYGEAVVGGIGTGYVRRVTAIGDSVNFASRIESANKALGTQFLISEDAYAAASSRAPLDARTHKIAIPGKSGEYTLYEVTGISEAEPVV